MLIDKLHSLLVHDAQGRPIPVRIVVNSRSRRIILRLSPEENGAILVIPREGLRKEGVRFAQDRVEWISARLALLPQPRPFADGVIIPVRGLPTRLSLSGPGRMTTLTPATDPTSPALLSSPGAPATFSDRVHRFLKLQARADLEASVTTHSARLGVEARRVTLKDTRSRWGSCASDGRLAFSWRLIFAPANVLDYVAAHECAHLIEMNHSPAFWAQVRRTYGDHRAARAWLKRHGHALHAIGLPAPDALAA
jgi:hypothetical protein